MATVQKKSSSKVPKVKSTPKKFVQKFVASCRTLLFTRKRLALVLLILIFAASGLGYRYKVDKNQQQKVKDAQAAAAKKSPKIGPYNTLVYAYKEGKTTKVRRYNVDTDKIDELFSFDELVSDARPDDSWQMITTNVALSHDTKKFAYVDKGSLMLRNSDGISKPLFTCTPSTEQPVSCYWDKTPQPSGDVPIAIQEPHWSLDDTQIGYRTMYFEGSSLALFNPTSSSFAELPDTYRNGLEELPALNEQTFVLKSADVALKNAGLYANNYLSQTAFLTSVFSPSSKLIIALFCPTNVANLGSELYTEGLARGPYGDCGENPKQLVSIDGMTGAYTKQFVGDFVSAVAVDDTHVAVTDTKDAWKIKQYDLATKKELSSLDLADLLKWPNSSIQQVDLSTFGGRVYAVVYFGEAGKRWYVSVVDVTAGKTISSSSIDHASGSFTLLGVY